MDEDGVHTMLMLLLLMMLLLMHMMLMVLIEVYAFKLAGDEDDVM